MKSIKDIFEVLKDHPRVIPPAFLKLNKLLEDIRILAAKEDSTKIFRMLSELDELELFTPAPDPYEASGRLAHVSKVTLLFPHGVTGKKAQQISICAEAIVNCGCGEGGMEPRGQGDYREDAMYFVFNYPDHPVKEKQICPTCNGSGEGYTDGSKCRDCKGKGQV